MLQKWEISTSRNRRTEMYEILIKMKPKFPMKTWFKMVEQAKEKGKLTEEEYQKLVSEVEA